MIMYFPRTKKIYLAEYVGWDWKVVCYKEGYYNFAYKWNVIIPSKFHHLMKNDDIVNLLGWIHENIVMKLEDLTYITLNVLIRILTGLLNKCDIDKDTKIELHDTIVSQLRNRKSYLISEDLPFQLQIIGLIYSSYCGQAISTMRVTRL